MRSVVVVGGGLSGLSAAVSAADAGWAVTLLEARARLGGATHSFTRAFDGDDGPAGTSIDRAPTGAGVVALPASLRGGRPPRGELS